MIHVQATASRSDRRAFVEFPFVRYRGHAHWVPPPRIVERMRLDQARDPFFEHAEMELFLARRGGIVCGRIAAIDDSRHRKIHADNLAAFGFFEAADEEAARELLAAVERFARARGRETVRGPLSPSMNHIAGLLIDGFDSDPMVMMPYNPPDYRSYLEGAGYAKVKDLFAWTFDVVAMTSVVEHYQQLLERQQERQRVVFRQFRYRDFKRQLSTFRQIYCRAWERNWGFVPPTEREFRYLAYQLGPLMDPRLTILAEVDGIPAGYALVLPDMNQVLRGARGNLLHGCVRFLRRKAIITQGRIVLLGVLPEYQQRGVFLLLMHELYRRILGSGYTRLEGSWVLEDNLGVNGPAEVLGGRRYKTYRLYEKSL